MAVVFSLLTAIKKVHMQKRYSSEATVHLLTAISQLIKPVDGKCIMANGKYRYAKCQKTFEETLTKTGLAIEKFTELDNGVLLHILTHNKHS